MGSNHHCRLHMSREASQTTKRETSNLLLKGRPPLWILHLFTKFHDCLNSLLPPSRTLQMTGKDRSQIKGTNAAAKDAGFEDFAAFLLAHGLRLHSHDDVVEGRAFLRAMGYGVQEGKRP